MQGTTILQASGQNHVLRSRTVTPEQMGHQVPQGAVVKFGQLHQEVFSEQITSGLEAGGPRVVHRVCMQGLSQEMKACVEVEGDLGSVSWGGMAGGYGCGGLRRVLSWYLAHGPKPLGTLAENGREHSETSWRGGVPDRSTFRPFSKPGTAVPRGPWTR